MPAYETAQGYINPWAQLWACRIHQRVRHKDDFLTYFQLKRRLKEIRQDYIGTNMPLTILVHDSIHNCPNVHAVEQLSEYLGKRIAFYLTLDLPADAPVLDHEDLAYSVMYFGLMLYAYDMVGDDSLDDLISWAECYCRDPEVIARVVEENLPQEISAECWAFVSENEIPPDRFVEATTAALAVLTGALYDPFHETI